MCILYIEVYLWKLKKLCVTLQVQLNSGVICFASVLIKLLSWCSLTEVTSK